MRRIWMVAALCAAACYKTPTPPCAFLCGPEGECPADYFCGDDNRCHHCLRHQCNQRCQYFVCGRC